MLVVVVAVLIIRHPLELAVLEGLVLVVLEVILMLLERLVLLIQEVVAVVAVEILVAPEQTAAQAAQASSS